MEHFFKKRILPAVTFQDSSDSLNVARAILSAGLNVMEVPFRTKVAADSVKQIRKNIPEMFIGAGTILTIDQLHNAIDSGAQFALSPGLNTKVVTEALKYNFPFVPGVMTPSEAEKALEFELTILKLFPASQVGGISMLRALNGPYSHTDVKFIPMGGVNINNLKEYLMEPNVMAVGGSWLASKKLIGEKKFDAIQRNTLEALQIADSIDRKS